MKRRSPAAVATLLAFSLLASGPAAADRQGAEEIFFLANQAYKEGRFEEALESYRELIRSEKEKGHLYYNLGNASLRLHDLGRAILSYERARLLIPRDPDLRFNLQYARDQLRDVVPDSRDFLEAIFFWNEHLTMRELFWIFALVNLLFWGTAVARLFSQSEWLYYSFVLLLASWLLAGASFGVKGYREATDERAVILPVETSVLAGPDTRDTVLFKLHQGTIVRRERSEDGWLLVSLPDRKRGWVPSASVESVLVRPLPSSPTAPKDDTLSEKTPQGRGGSGAQN